LAEVHTHRRIFIARTHRLFPATLLNMAFGQPGVFADRRPRANALGYGDRRPSAKVLHGLSVRLLRGRRGRSIGLRITGKATGTPITCPRNPSEKV
jgi:hypothetical protein